MDWGFISTSSNAQVEKLTGLNRETAFLVAVDHKYNNVWGHASRFKEPPIVWLSNMLTEIAPLSTRGKYTCIDLGGELGHNSAIQALLKRHSYKLRPTAPTYSNQNLLAKHPMQTIRNCMRSLLNGAGLEWKFWTYAFYHYLHILSWLPHSN